MDLDSFMHALSRQQKPIKCFTADNIMCRLRLRSHQHIRESDKGRCSEELVNSKPSRKPISIKTATLFRSLRSHYRGGRGENWKSNTINNVWRFLFLWPGDRTHFAIGPCDERIDQTPKCNQPYRIPYRRRRKTELTSTSVRPSEWTNQLRPPTDRCRNFITSTGRPLS